jgi:hypothetical protein
VQEALELELLHTEQVVLRHIGQLPIAYTLAQLASTEQVLLRLVLQTSIGPQVAHIVHPPQPVHRSLGAAS